MEEDIEYAEFGVKPCEIREEIWNRVRQKGMTLFTTMSELWSQKELSHVRGREALTKVHKQMIILDGPDAPETQTGQMEAQSGRKSKNRAKQDRHYFF